MKQQSVNGLLKPTKSWIKNNKEVNLNVAYLGHYLIVSYLQIFKIGNESQANVFGKDRVDVDEQGEFRFFLPEKEYIYEQMVTIEVYAPDGEFLGRTKTSYGNLYASGTSKSKKDTTAGIYEIEINPKLVTVERSDEKIKFYKKINGKLIDSSAQKDTTGLQIIIMAKEEEKDKYGAILSAQLDSSGYFYSQLEKHNLYDDAYAFIAGLDTEHIPISLEGGSFPKNIILVADLSGLVDEDIKKGIASLPNSNDLVNSSDFSQDLGGGCVDFTVPNRSLEEHSFFHTVRTTEPEIRSYTIGKNESRKFNQDLDVLTSSAFEMLKKLIDSWNSIGLYQYKKNSIPKYQIADKAPSAVANKKVIKSAIQPMQHEKDVAINNKVSTASSVYTKELKYMSNSLKVVSVPVNLEIDDSYINAILDAIATYSANKRKLEQLHSKVQQAYCSSSVEIDNTGYCENATIPVEDNTNYNILERDIKNFLDNITSNNYTKPLDNDTFNTRVIDFLNKLSSIKKIDALQRKKYNKTIDDFIEILEISIKEDEHYISNKEGEVYSSKINYSESVSYKTVVKKYLMYIRENINYGIENDFCVDDNKSVAGIICLMKDYEKLKETLSGKAIFTLGEIIDMGAFYNEFELSIRNFSSLLEDFHTFYRKCNDKMLFMQDDYFIKNYSNIKSELEQLKLSILIARNKIDKIELEYIYNHPGRKNLSVETSVDWDETPTVFENTTIAHGHILHFKQVWKADGYSLGDLLYSLPLAPCQEKQIAIIDWDRKEEASRTEEQRVTDSLSTSLSRDRDIDEIINSTFAENINASSANKTSSTSGGGSAGLGFSKGGFVLGASGGVSHSGSSSVSSSSQNSSRNLAGSTLNRLQDNVSQSANSVRSQRNTVIQAVGQNESVNVQTEVIKNNNHCHSMTIEYFEVLRHYAVEQELVDAQECLFVPLPMSNFDHQKVLRWKNTLQSSMYGKDLLKGFDAIERINSSLDTGFPKESYADEIIQELSGYFTISFNLTRPYIDEIEEETKTIIKTKKIELRGFFPWSTRTLSFSYPVERPLTEMEKDEIFEREYAPDIVSGFIRTMGIYAIDEKGYELDLNTDVTLLTNYAKGKALKVNVALNPRSKITRRDIKHLLFRAHTSVTQSSDIIIKSAYIHYKTDHISEYLLRNGSINNDIISTKIISKTPLDGGWDMVEKTTPSLWNPDGYGYVYVTDAALVYTPMTAKEKRNPKDEDNLAAERLIGFLNEHLEMAHKAIWSNIDSSRLFGLLDGYIAPNAKGRSVASVVENKVMGIVGNNLVLKVVPGEQLDPMLRGSDLLEHYKPQTKPDPFRISVPTKGVYAESVMGKCNSCEEIDESRHWRFEDVPCGTKSTSIDSVSTASRKADVGNLQVKDLPTNIINMQTPQAAPDPSGLMAAYGLLGKSDAFKDMTGLQGTQANALGALKTTSQSVTDLASVSKDFANLAVMAAQKKDASRQISEIKKLKKEGVYNSSEAKDKINAVIDTYPNAAKSLMPENNRESSTIDKAFTEGIKKGYINKGSNISLQEKDKSFKVDNSGYTNIATTGSATMPEGLGDVKNYNILRLPKNIDKNKSNALVLLTYEDDGIMKYDESMKDVFEIEKRYNTYVVLIKTVADFINVHKNASDYFKTKTGALLSFFYIHAHGSSKSITLSKNNTLLATSLCEMKLSDYYEQNPKGIVNSCLTAVNYFSSKYHKLTSFAQELSNSMKASIQAAITETNGSLTNDLQLVEKGDYIKSGFSEDNTGYFLTSEGFCFDVKRFKTDVEMEVTYDEFIQEDRNIIKKVPFKEDGTYAYLLSRFVTDGNKYVNNVNLNIKEFHADKVFKIIPDINGTISSEYFITLEPKPCD